MNKNEQNRVVPWGRVRFSPAQIEQIARTVSRAREVVVKVTKGATSTAGAIAHLRYIDRNRELEIETDEGEHLKGKGIEKDIIGDWDLDSANAQGRGPYRGKAGRKPARLVHNVILSMPKGTSPEKLLRASRDFAREQFALKHRYVLTLQRTRTIRTCIWSSGQWARTGSGSISAEPPCGSGEDCSPSTCALTVSRLTQPSAR